MLCRDGHLQRSGRGRYRYRRWGESEAAKAQAARDLAWVTDPANFPKPIKRKTLPFRVGSTTSKAFAVLGASPGKPFTSHTLAAELGVHHKTAHNALYSLYQTGRIKRGSGFGEYFVPAPPTPAPAPEPTDDPLERLEAIQARLDDDQPTPTEPAPAVIEPPTVPVVHASIDDEIDALLELLVPGGLKARYFDHGHRWYLATRDLLEAVRRDGEDVE